MTTCVSRPPWTDKYKQNWDDAYSRLMAWWEGASLDRPIVINSVAKPDVPPFDGPKSIPEMEKADLDADFRCRSTQYGLETRLYLAESVPRAWTQYGNLICLLGSMAGAKTHYHSHAIWIGEINNLLDSPLPEFDPTNPAYAFAIAMIHAHARTHGYDVVLGANPMIDPLTTLSMMLGPNQFYLEVIDHPELIKRWTQRLGDMFMQIVQGYRQARAAHGRREDINWTGLWAPGDMDALQCDASALLSPEMFNEFALPELERQAEFMDFGLWHLDGAGELPHIESICAVPGMRAIQWIDAQYAPQMKYIDAWKKIRKLGKSLMFSRCDLDQAIALTRALGRDGLAFDLWPISTEAEMESALRRLRNV